MNERELLELAAKAVGYEPSMPELIGMDGWNPLDSDADAFRLAVKLKLIVTFADGGSGPHVCAGQRLGPFSNETLPVKMFALDEELACTRRAITRAAAAIGEAMP